MDKFSNHSGKNPDNYEQKTEKTHTINDINKRELNNNEEKSEKSP